MVQAIARIQNQTEPVAGYRVSRSNTLRDERVPGPGGLRFRDVGGQISEPFCAPSVTQSRAVMLQVDGVGRLQWLRSHTHVRRVWIRQGGRVYAPCGKKIAANPAI